MEITDTGTTLIISELTKDEKERIITATKSASSTQPNLLTRKEVAAILKIHSGSVKRYDRAGTLHPVRINARTIRYLESEVLGLLIVKGAA